MAELYMEVKDIKKGGPILLQGFRLPQHRFVIERFVMVPENSPGWAKNTWELWDKLERETRGGGVIARQVVVRLPGEFDDKERSRMVRKFVEDHFVQKGFAAEAAIQGPPMGNPAFHARILVAVRPFQGDGFASGRGLLITPFTVKKWFAAWEQVLNDGLRAKGLGPARKPISMAEKERREVRQNFEFLYGHLGDYLKGGRGDVQADPQNQNYRMIGLIAEKLGLVHNVELPPHEREMAKHLPKAQLLELVMKPSKVPNLALEH